jgi:hypothetical protein
MQSDPVISLALIPAAILLLIAVGVLARAKLSGFNNLGQGLVGLAAALGVVVAASAYFAERQDKPRVGLSTRAVVIPLSAAKGSSSNALIQFVTTIENNARRPMEVACAGLDARGIVARGALARNKRDANDLEAEPLLRETTTGEVWNDCMKTARKEYPDFEPPASGFRYRTFLLEPGEARSRHFELVAPCRYAAIRFTFSVPKPGDSKHLYEVKRLVPLTDTCRDREVYSTM